MVSLALFFCLLQKGLGLICQTPDIVYTPTSDSFDATVWENLAFIVGSLLPTIENLPHQEWWSKLHASALHPTVINNVPHLTCVFNCGYAVETIGNFLSLL